MKVGMRILFICLAAAAFAQGFSQSLKPASLFTDNMVLQQGRKNPVWGTAAEGEKITVEMNGKKASAQVRDGKWMVRLPRMKQGGPYTMTISCAAEKIELKNVLVGEVWVASGQSNMEWTLINARNADTEIAAAKYPNIRFFTVEKAASIKPLDQVKGTWQECNPKNAASFSAVAYFFARKLHVDDGLNIGIIHTSWGGTPAEAWTDEATLAVDPELASLLGPLEAFKSSSGLGLKELEKKMNRWEAFWDTVFQDTEKLKAGWASPGVDLSEWEDADVPKSGSILGSMDGVVWYRRDVDIPESWQGRDLILKLGAIDDYDITYFNGNEVGRIYKDTPGWYLVPREYVIPAALVRPGKNTVAVRIADNWLGGGFGGDPNLMKIFPAEGPETEVVNLSGIWKSRLEFKFDNAKHPARPEQSNESQISTLLYNAMIHPLVPYGIRGAIWYQGESNASQYIQYRRLFPTMIRNWRRAWGIGDFPFYYVQLANYMQRYDSPTESEWAGLREAQTMTLKLKNTGMAVIIDVGEAADIHPRNKQDVGKRLALWAESKDYGVKQEYSGPLFKKMKVKDGKAIVEFDHAKGGLVVQGDGQAKGFAIAGQDGKFVWADAVIDGNKVILSSPEVKAPAAVRYGWANNPDVNLYNKAGLPASPFRMDVE
ncbi:9-O-acetylesterase [bacterium]|nr:9-O-acetylesterase [bacterium]